MKEFIAFMFLIGVTCIIGYGLYLEPGLARAAGVIVVAVCFIYALGWSIGVLFPDKPSGPRKKGHK